MSMHLLPVELQRLMLEGKLAPEVKPLILNRTIEADNAIQLARLEVDRQYDQLAEAKYYTKKAFKNYINNLLGQNRRILRLKLNAKGWLIPDSPSDLIIWHKIGFAHIEEFNPRASLNAELISNVIKVCEKYRVDLHIAWEE